MSKSYILAFALLAFLISACSDDTVSPQTTSKPSSVKWYNTMFNSETNSWNESTKTLARSWEFDYGKSLYDAFYMYLYGKNYMKGSFYLCFGILTKEIRSYVEQPDTTEYIFDESGKLKQEIVRSSITGDTKEDYFTENGRILTTVKTSLNTNEKQSITYFTYGENGYISELTTYTFDGNGDSSLFITQEYAHAVSGCMISYKEYYGAEKQLMEHLEYTNNSDGYIIEEKNFMENSVTKYEYNSDGNWSLIDAGSNKLEISYNGLGLPVEIITYDRSGGKLSKGVFEYE